MANWLCNYQARIGQRPHTNGRRPSPDAAFLDYRRLMLAQIPYIERTGISKSDATRLRVRYQFLSQFDGFRVTTEYNKQTQTFRCYRAVPAIVSSRDGKLYKENLGLNINARLPGNDLFGFKQMRPAFHCATPETVNGQLRWRPIEDFKTLPTRYNNDIPFHPGDLYTIGPLSLDKVGIDFYKYFIQRKEKYEEQFYATIQDYSTLHRPPILDKHGREIGKCEDKNQFTPMTMKQFFEHKKQCENDLIDFYSYSQSTYDYVENNYRSFMFANVTASDLDGDLFYIIYRKVEDARYNENTGEKRTQDEWRGELYDRKWGWK